jgi:NADH-quinone oxidoreductase subunit J
VATALISTMIFLGGVYGLLGVHFIAAFQVLIYVGAVMVFMVYVIMLLDPRDPAVRSRFSPLVVPGIVGGLVLAWALVHAVHGLLGNATSTPARFGLKEFSVSFLNEYWLHFELTSVLLVAAVVAALAVIRVSRRTAAGPAGKAPHG